ncbi:MAG: M18 family aminopeptidase [Lachnospiraceae bacterium]|uniref:M18 family aminopeptidase n=1 Tax=Roseburia hominis TaxID=301301 RepID=UPI001F3D414D|nr:M18 family aminopeptidase [Roseburia hominis]MCI5712377.1 M18 family aminopeptidase [Lachnospiraceae bacterium]MDD6168914.1 M18 family aminopeptidase [Lachnospiraceae bacterium]MDY4839207.1 M18 family aminopeptidase [Lachnospiraceae bacterium]
MKEIETLFKLIENGTSPFHVVLNCKEQLQKAGFQELNFSDKWKLNPGEKYYVNHHDSTLFAFTLPKTTKNMGNIRMAAAHTDFPCFCIKSNPELKKGEYVSLNVEAYGGFMLNTWLDRPLSVAGRVSVKSKEVYKPGIRFLDIKRPVLTIPNLAIHMNHDVNKGVALNKQVDMLPLFGMAQEGSEDFMEFLAKELQVKKSDILDFQLYVYCAEEPILLGTKEEFISSPRLDNLTSAQALVSAIIQADRTDGMNLIALFDHEEIGSKTKQGAGSFMLQELVNRILFCMDIDMEEQSRIKYDSMLLSVDVAHAMHPNQMEKADPTNKPVLNKGFCIKKACSQSYVTDCEAIGIVEQICKAKKIPYQKYANRSDIPGGSTLGSIASSLFPVKTVDVGVPILAMHSARELMGKEDMNALYKVVKGFMEL